MDDIAGSSLWMRYLREEPVATVVAAGLVLWSLSSQLSVDLLTLTLGILGFGFIKAVVDFSRHFWAGEISTSVVDAFEEDVKGSDSRARMHDRSG